MLKHYFYVCRIGSVSRCFVRAFVWYRDERKALFPIAVCMEFLEEPITIFNLEKTLKVINRQFQKPLISIDAGLVGKEKVSSIFGLRITCTKQGITKGASKSGIII